MQDSEDSSQKTESHERVQFSHEELVKLTKDAIDKIIESDPLFEGLPSDATIEEIKAKTAVAKGQAITVYVNRGKLPKIATVVPPNTTTVLDLKKAIRRQTNLALQREGTNMKISWKHVWRKYHLCFEDVVLRDDNANIKKYGISNRVELYYKRNKRREMCLDFNN